MSHNLLKKDRLSELPDEILLSIMCNFMTTKEAARNSVLSRRWRNLWLCFPVLEFKGSTSQEDIYSYYEEREAGGRIFSYDPQKMYQVRSKFVKRVNHVINNHVGPSIDKFEVSFDLPNDFQSDIDKWVAFALEKQAKSLVLALQLDPLYDQKFSDYTLSVGDLDAGVKFISLKSLSLKFVNVSTETLELLLNSCTNLEELCIEFSTSLTSIRAPSSLSLALKHLHVCQCFELEDIDISSAPKLLSFTYWGHSIKLHIGNAPLLYDASIGFGGLSYESIAYAFDPNSMRHSQLEYLHLRISMLNEMNLGIDLIPTLTNLKHLILDVFTRPNNSILGLVPLIEASPVLQKLTLQSWIPLSSFEFNLGRQHYPRAEERAKPDGKPLICFNTLEFVNFVGCLTEVEFVTHVIENAIMLQEVIVHVHRRWFDYISEQAKEDAMKKLQSKLPQGVNFILK